MGKIVCLIGKSSSGKDTIYKMLLDQKEIPFQRIVPYTTRPIRSGEQNGAEYIFTDENGLKYLIDKRRCVEQRAYHTIYGDLEIFYCR